MSRFQDHSPTIIQLQRDAAWIRMSPVLQIVERALASVLVLSLLTLLVGDFLLGLPFGARSIVVALIIGAAAGLVGLHVVAHSRRRNADGH